MIKILEMEKKFRSFFRKIEFLIMNNTINTDRKQKIHNQKKSSSKKPPFQIMLSQVNDELSNEIQKITPKGPFIKTQKITFKGPFTLWPEIKTFHGLITLPKLKVLNI